MTEELLSNSMTALTLGEQLQDKTPEQWAGWLQNNRNRTRRVPYRIPFQRINGGIFYAREELEKFVEFEKQRTIGTIKLTGRAAEVLRAYGGTPYGHPFKGGSANLTITNSGERFIRIVIDEPFMVIAATPEQAIEFGKELVEVGQVAQRMSRESEQNKPDLTGYEVVTDNQDVKIMRKAKS